MNGLYIDPGVQLDGPGLELRKLNRLDRMEQAIQELRAMLIKARIEIGLPPAAAQTGDKNEGRQAA